MGAAARALAETRYDAASNASRLLGMLAEVRS
jgi:hypothetical protein